MDVTVRTYLIGPQGTLFHEFNTLLTATLALAIAAELHVSGHVNYNAGDYLTIEGKLCAKEVRLPLVGPVAAALMDRLPDLIELTVVEGIKGNTSFRHQTGGLRALLISLFQPFVVNFYERHKGTLHGRFGQDRTTWPDSWQMGWLVRNGASHGNQVY